MSDEIKFTRELTVHPQHSIALIVSESDWKHLRNTISKQKKPNEVWLSVAFLGFGISFGGAYSLFSLLASTGVPSWMITASWVGVIGGAITGAACLAGHRGSSKRVQEYVGDSIDVMDTIESTFKSESKST